MTKHTAITLLLCGISAVAVGQTVACDDCTHVASVYMGEGGVIATWDDAYDDSYSYTVTWVATCGNVTRSGELAADIDGTVALLLGMDNGLACMAEGGGSFEMGPVKDGGWFWITDADNSAVGSLIAKDVLENDTVDITSAGSGVSTTEGKGAVFLKETATGRVGILPTILPEPSVSPLRKCGYAGAGTAQSPYKRLNKECAMGDGGTEIWVTYEDTFTGRTIRVPDGGKITRPYPFGRAAIVVTIDLWGNGSGHFHCDANIGCGEPSQSSVMLGQLDVVEKGLVVPNAATFSQSRNMTRLKGAYFSIEEGYQFPAAIGNCPGANPCGATRAGLSADFRSHSDVVTLGIRPDQAYCNNYLNWYPALVTITAAIGEAGSLLVEPRIERDTSKSIGTNLDSPATVAGVTATTRFEVVCAPPP